MKRRRLVALVAAIGLFSLGLVFAVFVGVVTHTRAGQQGLANVVRDWFLAPNCECIWTVGPISGGLLTGLSIDGVKINDKNGELFFSARRVAVTYNIFDLIDRRILLRTVTLNEPYVHLRQFRNRATPDPDDDTWNYRRIFKMKEGQKKDTLAKTLTPDRLLVLDSVRIVDGMFELSQLWSPDDSLRGARADSSIRVHLARTDQRYDRTIDGDITHRFQWTKLNGLLPHLRLSHPDSNRFGQEFVIGSLRVDERDPPFAFHNASGKLRKLGDSLFVDSLHFDLPGSTANASGRVWWGGDHRPTRYNLTIRSDSVDLKDIAWIYPTLPRTGGGSMVLHIRTDPRNERVIDYVLNEMDVRSTKSHLTGDMTFAVGGPVLGVKNVNVVASPVDFDLIRAFAGGPLSQDWQGQLIGTVKATGGPLNKFDVQSLQAEWRDTHVPGAVSRFAGKGGLNILSPALTVFRDFHADIGSLDLRSIRFLFPDFPPLNGTIAGVATLDSIWSDVRFRDADLTHTDGPDAPTRVTGAGRLTSATTMSYDVELDAKQIGFDMLRRSYPTLPLKGVMAGPIRARGSLPDLELSLNLQGAAGALSFDGRLDIDSLGGYGMHGRGQVAQLDLHALLVDTAQVPTVLNGQYDADVLWQSIPTITGRVAADLERSRWDSLQVTRAHANLSFADGKVRLTDSLSLVTPAATIVGIKGGAIGLPQGSSDSLRFSITDINLQELRRYLTTIVAPEDSLSAGPLVVSNSSMVSGRLDSLRVRGALSGTDIVVGTKRADSASVTVDVDRALTNRTGIVSAWGAGLTVGGLTFESTYDTLQLFDSTAGTFTIRASSSRRPDISAYALWSRLGDSTTIRAQSARLVLPKSEWNLAAPASVIFGRSGMRMDPFELTRDSVGSLMLGGTVPEVGAATFSARGRGIPLADVASVFRLRGSYAGMGSFSVTAAGTKSDPTITLDSLVVDSLGIGLAGAKADTIGRARVTGTYQKQNMVADLTLIPTRASSNVFAHAELPMDITLFSGKPLDDRISGVINADSLSFIVLQPLFSGMTLKGGQVQANVKFAGKRSDPRFYGSATIKNGGMVIDSMYTTFSNIQGTLALSGDTVTIGPNGLTATTNPTLKGWDVGSARLGGMFWGWKGGAAATFNPNFALKMSADKLLVMDDRALATVEISTADNTLLQLDGTLDRPELSGSVVLARASIYMPDPTEATKLVSSIESASAAADDSSTIGRLITNLKFPKLQVALGEEVRLKTIGSDVVDVELTSPEPLTVTRDERYIDPADAAFVPKWFRGIGLLGEMQPVSGTYVFRIGPVQKQFTVQRGGQISFARGPNPTLNISARTTARVSGGAQEERIDVVATLIGTLRQPRVRLATDQLYSESDLFFILAVGKPEFALDQSAVASILSSTGSAFFSSLLRKGARLDAVTLDIASDKLLTNLTGGSAKDALFGGRLTGEKQLSDKVFLTFTTGLCALKSSSFDTRLSTFGQGLGGTITFRPDSTSRPFGFKLPTKGSPSFSAFAEPPTTAQFCTPGTLGLNGLAPTPRQFGLKIGNHWVW